MYVIWNLTRVCPWNCSFCCVAAIFANDKVDAEIKCAKEISHRRQLVFDEKIQVLKILASQDVEIDFSGGDPLFCEDDIKVLEKAVSIMPAEKIDVSMTGTALDQRKINILKKVGKAEFTLDNLPGVVNPLRPKGYNIATMEVMMQLLEYDINASAVTTLHKYTMSKENLIAIYKWLCENKVKTWSILKFYPVGRGTKNGHLILSKDVYLEIMEFLRGLKGYTDIVFQHSMRVLENNYKCHAGVETVGVLPDGRVTACAWALDEKCNPLENFYIGKLPEDDFEDMLKNARQNMGYGKRPNFCRITKQ